MTRFLNFALSHIFGDGEARHFIFYALLDTQEYWCMHDISTTYTTPEKDVFRVT